IPGQGKPIAAATLAHAEPMPMRTELGSPVVKERQTTTVAAVFPSAFSPAESNVHMDITDTSGAIVGSKLLPVRKEGGHFVARGSFEAPSWGSMLLTFFALGRQDGQHSLGLLVSGQNLVVQTDRELQVELEGLSEAVRPGAPLAVRARVRDRQGQDVEFSLGAALVDRNILALKDPLEVTPMDRFYNPELRTMSTTGSKILTWPVVTRNWGTEQHDIALPPFPWREGGPIESCKQHWDEEDYEAVGESAGMGFGSGMGSIGTIGHGAGGGARVEITIRTRFPATALWEPHLKGKGTVDIRGRFPDSIGEQELIVVASDKRGGVGLVRKPVRVTQPVFIEADLPSPAIAGEEVWLPARVHNLTDRDGTFTLELGNQRRGLAIAKGAAGAAHMPLRMVAVGQQEVQLRAVGGGHDDRVVRRIEVAPRGVPIARVRSATLTSEPLKMTFDVPKVAADADAHLRIEFPAVTSAFAGIENIARTIGDDPWSLATDLTSAALVLDLAKRHRVASERIEELRGEALAALTMVARIQRKDGSFGYWRNGKSSPYITAVLLEGLLEARRIGLPAPKATIDKAASHLASKLEGGDLIDVREIGWWEGDTTRVRYGITAEVFDALARLPADQRRGKVGLAIDRLVPRYQKYLETSAIDPLAAGRGLAALIRLGKITPANARRIAARLLRERDEGHVEPSWFHAYGGRVDATLAVLEALELADATGFAAEKRDALSWILSTRPSWGDWHNEAGTTAALRALALVGAAPSEVKGSVVVKLDGKIVHRADVDPKDPWLSTASLAHLDLGRHLRAGRHQVEISYSGALRPAVSLTSRFWHKGKAGEASSKGATLKVDGPHTVARGASATLHVKASGERVAGGTIVIGHSGLLDLDMGALSAMTGRGRTISALRTTERGLELRIAPSAKDVRLALPYHAIRSGRGHLPTIAWFGRSQPLVVDVGKLVVH
ncbi:MAG TPA: alpha-2-macroglobulin family protein, partial [Polyangiaceae bacterium]|nr:alpha-2-macroglobulin family protein [Polyangiaceae bacterium]